MSWYLSCILLLLLSSTVSQTCWAFGFTDGLGGGFLNTYNWELNRKRGVTFSANYNKPRKKAKHRYSSSTKWTNLFEVLKEPKSVFATKKSEQYGLLLERWKKKRKSMSFVAFTHSYQHEGGLTYQDYDGGTSGISDSVYSNCRRKLPIVFDTGASMSISPVRVDFIGDLEPAPISSLQGLKDKVSIVGIGTVRWTIYDKHGVTRDIKTRAYYIPEGNIRLLSPQSYLQESKKGQGKITKDDIEFTLPDGTVMIFPYNRDSNIPLMLTKEKQIVGFTLDDAEFLGTQNVASYLSVAAEVNQNITAAQKELLLWHWRLGHASFKRVQWLFSIPREKDEALNKTLLVSKHPKVSSCKNPLCIACQIAKQSRRGSESIKHTTIKEK